MEPKLQALVKSLVVLVLLLPIVGGLAYWAGRRAERGNASRPAAVVSRSQQPERRPPSSPLAAPRREALAPTPAPTAPTPPTPESLLTVCEAGWNEIARNDLPTLELDLLRRQLHLTEPCLIRMGAEITSPAIRGFVQECQLALAQKSERQIEQSCVPRMADFRSFLIWNLKGGEGNLAEFELPELANQLFGSTVDLKSASRADLDRITALANEVINRNPDVYEAHKAKLLATLLKELKFGEQVDRSVYDAAYDELTSFSYYGEGDRIAEEASALGGTLAAPELANIDRDLVHLPFLRYGAIGDHETVAQMAEEYIASYPQSYVGYYYLADAAWSSGREAEAIATFRRGLGGGVSAEAAYEIFKGMRAKSPLERLEELGLD